MNILFSYENQGDLATLTQGSEHISFPAVNVQHRWFLKSYRSKYGSGSAWGLFRVTAAKQIIPFDEGGGTLTATLTPGDYDATSILAEIKTQMETAGALTYTPAYSETTNKFTIAGSGNFILKLSVVANSAFPMFGWIAAIDTANAATHTAPLLRIHTEEELKFAMVGSPQLSFIAIKNHNLQSTATIQLLHYSDAYITLQQTDTLTWKADLIAAVIDRNYPYVKLRIVDVNNPDLYVEIGRVWMGETIRPRIGFAMERKVVPEDPSVISESENGQEASIQRTKYKNWNYVFEGVDPTDKADIDAMFEAVGKSRPLFICEKPDEADITPYTYYVRFTNWEWEHLVGDWWRLSVEVKSER